MLGSNQCDGYMKLICGGPFVNTCHSCSRAGLRSWPEEDNALLRPLSGHAELASARFNKGCCAREMLSHEKVLLGLKQFKSNDLLGCTMKVEKIQFHKQCVSASSTCQLRKLLRCAVH